MPLTEIQMQHGPFAQAFWPGRDYVLTCGTDERVAMVRKSCDADWLEAVIVHGDTQKTVRLAAERRLRWVNKANKGLMAKYKEQNP